MKKISVLFALILLMIGNVYAQKKSNYGFYLGCGVNWMKIDNSLYYDDSKVNMENEVIHLTDTTIVHTLSASYLDVNDAKVKPMASFMIGGFYEYQASDLFGLQFDLMYNQYGYKLTGNVEVDNDSSSGTTVYDYKSTTKMNNISLAVLAKFHILNQHLSIDFGVQPSFCLRATKDAHRAISTNTVTYVSGTDYRPFNLSIVGGLTGNISEHLFVGARYNYGLLDMLYTKTAYLVENDDHSKIVKYLYSDKPEESKTSSVQITVGYKF